MSCGSAAEATPPVGIYVFIGKRDRNARARCAVTVAEEYALACADRTRTTGPVEMFLVGRRSSAARHRRRPVPFCFQQEYLSRCGFRPEHKTVYNWNGNR